MSCNTEASMNAPPLRAILVSGVGFWICEHDQPPKQRALVGTSRDIPSGNTRQHMDDFRQGVASQEQQQIVATTLKTDGKRDREQTH